MSFFKETEPQRYTKFHVESHQISTAVVNKINIVTQILIWYLKLKILQVQVINQHDTDKIIDMWINGREDPNMSTCKYNHLILDKDAKKTTL